MEPMRKKEGKSRMKTSFRGNEDGYALLLSVTLILILSMTYMAAVPYVSATRAYARETRERVMANIASDNAYVTEKYELH